MKVWVREFWPSAQMGEQGAVFPRSGGFVEEREQAASFDLGLGFGWERCSGDFREGGKEVDVCGERVAIGGLDGSGPTPKGVCPRRPDPRGTFCSTHLGVEHAYACRSPIVVHENHQRVLTDSPIVQFAEDFADVLIDVVDHPEKALRVVREAFFRIQGFVLWAGMIGAVGCVGRDVGEEGFSCLVLCFNPARGLVVKYVSTVSLSPFERSVVKDGRVEVRV